MAGFFFAFVFLTGVVYSGYCPFSLKIALFNTFNTERGVYSRYRGTWHRSRDTREVFSEIVIVSRQVPIPL